jgi:4-hydroxybenzoyl-CoA thioesterase
MNKLSLPTGAFTVRTPIRFSDCDPAGIVFFPAFFRMFNDVFEDWMNAVVGMPFADEFLKHQHMFPLAHVDVDFKSARAMGQTIDLTLILTGLGRSSIKYTIVGHDAGVECLSGRFVTCTASKQTMKTIPIPGYLRGPMERYLEVCREWIE